METLYLWSDLSSSLAVEEQGGRKFLPLYCFSSRSHTRELIGASGQGGSGFPDGEAPAQGEGAAGPRGGLGGGGGAGATLGVSWPRLSAVVHHLPSCPANPSLREMSQVVPRKKEVWEVLCMLPPSLEAVS